MFPPGFLWGAATSAYQIEGAVGEDGRGPSIWDVFSHAPGNVAGGDTGDVATDHYHRAHSHVALMADLGLRIYRFSVSWPRVQPDGAGAINRRGLDFYSRLVDALTERGITPMLTLYHWDLPAALQERGGWINRDTAGRFADYAATVHRALGDRVRLWITINEPWCVAFLGYSAGLHAPGVTDPAAALAAAHHLLLGHGLAVQAMRAEHTLVKPQLSIALNLAPVRRAPESPEPGPARRVDGLRNRLFLEPILLGRYPPDVVEDTRLISDWGFVGGDDLTIAATPVDWLGVNYYTPVVVAGVTDPADEPSAYPGCEDVVLGCPEGPVTTMGWPIDPAGLYELLVDLHQRYPGVPLVVTESGAAFDDVVTDGRVRDAQRIRFLDQHLRAAHAAIRRGVDLRGYVVWSLLDNFEWTAGYQPRFGLVYVDRHSQQLIPKDSAYWYRDVMRHNALPPPGLH